MEPLGVANKVPRRTPESSDAKRSARRPAARSHASLASAVKRMRASLRNSEASVTEAKRALLTLNSIGDAVLSSDLSGHVTYLNRMAESMTGWPRAEAVGRPLADVFKILDATTRQPAPDPMALAVLERKPETLTPNTVLVRRDGAECAIEDSAAPIYGRGGVPVGAVIVFRDVSESRRRAAHMSHLAEHDPLTDLPNRALIKDRLEQAISLARRHNHRIAVLFVDLDRFKHVNDTLGHVYGDELLKAVATRLKGLVRRSDTVGRLGGDEFIVVLSELGSAGTAADSATKFLTALAVPYQVGPHSLCVPASIGVSIYPSGGENAESLIQSADAAMYRAKAIGPNRCAVWELDTNGSNVPRRAHVPTRPSAKPRAR